MSEIPSLEKKQTPKNPVKWVFFQLHRLYHWTMSWSEHKWGTWVLGVLSFAEASFFPIPPDVLLIPLCLGKKQRIWLYWLVCTVTSGLGGAFGYYLGWAFFDSLARPILEFYGAMEAFAKMSDLYREYDALIVFTAGFTPIPFKVATVAAGASEINFGVFLIASILSRGARFGLISLAIYFFGEKARAFLEKHFNKLTVIALILGILGFLMLKVVFH